MSADETPNPGEGTATSITWAPKVYCNAPFPGLLGPLLVIGCGEEAGEHEWHRCVIADPEDAKLKRARTGIVAQVIPGYEHVELRWKAATA